MLLHSAALGGPTLRLFRIATTGLNGSASPKIRQFSTRFAVTLALQHLKCWRSSGAVLLSRAAWERYFANDLPAEFIVKPTLGAYGKGFRLYRKEADDFSAAALYDHLTKSTEWDSFVIQRRARNHPDIRELAGSEALQTARIVTWVVPPPPRQ